MNHLMQEQWSWFEGMQSMRTLLLDSLSDADLLFNPGGTNITFGALCVQMGETEHSYVESLKTLKQEWSYHNTDTGMATSISKLKSWFHSMEAEMKELVSAFSDEDLKQNIDRGFNLSIELQLQVYLQALFIFFGKATIYVKAMNKALPKQIEDWIG